MQTSSNFFNKSFFVLDEEGFSKKKKDKYYESHIVLDPLRLKEQLTPWTEINPKYNFNTERLIKFKQKLSQQQKSEELNEQPEQVKDAKQLKAQMISNLFNFYKNNKEKKRSTLNNAKRKTKYELSNFQQTDDGWELPPIIMEKQALEEDLVQNKQSIHKNQQKPKEQKPKPQKKQKNSNFIESISIRQYLMKLKQKQKIISMSTLPQDSTTKDKLQIDLFSPNRHSKNKSKVLITNSISSIRDIVHENHSQRYGSIRNPQHQNYKRRPYISSLQSLEQSFQIYKKAAQMEVQQNIGNRKTLQKYPRSTNSTLIVDKQHWKNNISLGSLNSSPNLQNSKPSKSMSLNNSPQKKYNTISYDRSFSPTHEKLNLPKVAKNHSYRH